MTTVLLVRHGETAWNREHRVQGWAPTGLTDRGREQARAAGPWLSERYDVDRVVSSDLRRTRETASLLDAAGEGLPEPGFDRAWRERGFGVYQGFLAEELFERHPDHDVESLTALDVAPEGSESVTGFCDRVERAWRTHVDAASPSETVLVVTHGGVIKVVRGLVTGEGRVPALERESPSNCSVTEITVTDGTSRLQRDGATDWGD